MFDFVHTDIGTYKVLHVNGTDCGELLQGDDGFYCWWPPYPNKGGCFPEYFFTVVAKKLEQLNKPAVLAILELGSDNSG